MRLKIKQKKRGKKMRSLATLGGDYHNNSSF